MKKISITFAFLFLANQTNAACCGAVVASAVKAGLGVQTRLVGQILKEQTNTLSAISKNLANLAATNTLLKEKEIKYDEYLQKNTIKKTQALMEAEAVAKITMEGVQSFGYQNPKRVCQEYQRIDTNSVANQNSIQRTVSEELTEHLRGYADINEYTAKITNELKTEDIDTSIISPVAGYYKNPQEIKAAVLAGTLLIDDDPFIVPKDENVYNTLAGAVYKKLHLQKMAKLAPAQSAIAREISDNTPSIPLTDWYKTNASQIGMAISPETEKMKLISKNQFTEMLVQAKFSNPQYWIDVHKSFGGDLKRKLIKVSSEQLFLEKELLDQERLQSAMLASMVSDATSEAYKDELIEEYNRVVRVSGVKE